MSVPSERSRRSTAGKRITELTGEALEQDQSFWGHETWEEDGSGNESFHSSDEDSELKRDVFDSDFDLSESDNEEEELEAGNAEERELARQEREVRAANNRSYIDTKKDFVKSKTVKGIKGKTKRIVGDGLNAGIVLNIPHASEARNHTNFPVLPLVHSQPNVTLQSNTKKSQKTDKIPSITAASFRPTRVATRVGREAAKTEVSSPTISTGNSKSTNLAKKKKRRYTQEELLLEAVQITEPENERWLLGRKRQQLASEKEKELASREVRGKLIEKYVSRRGYLNTINFPDMDHLPAILKRKDEILKPCPESLCVVTGEPARYRDPKTMLGYYDIAAFKELRRRYEAHEPLVQTISTTSKRKNGKKPPPIMCLSPVKTDAVTNKSNSISTRNTSLANGTSSPLKEPLLAKSQLLDNSRHEAVEARSSTHLHCHDTIKRPTKAPNGNHLTYIQSAETFDRNIEPEKCLNLPIDVVLPESIDVKSSAKNQANVNPELTLKSTSPKDRNNVQREFQHSEKKSPPTKNGNVIFTDGIKHEQNHGFLNNSTASHAQPLIVNAAQESNDMSTNGHQQKTEVIVSPKRIIDTHLPGTRRSPRSRQPSQRLLENLESERNSLLLIPSITQNSFGTSYEDTVPSPK